VNWELKFDKVADNEFADLLQSQKEEANIQFAKFIENNYEEEDLQMRKSSKFKKFTELFSR